jgi:hypothetical protein
MGFVCLQYSTLDNKGKQVLRLKAEQMRTIQWHLWLDLPSLLLLLLVRN